MNDTIGTNITKNYKIVLLVSSIEPYYGNSINIVIEPANIAIVRDLNSNPVNTTGASITKNYTLSTVAPTVMVTSRQLFLEIQPIQPVDAFESLVVRIIVVNLELREYLIFLHCHKH
jgi:hypothetical protein